MLRLKLSGKKKQNRLENSANAVKKRKKFILENIKTNNSEEADKPGISLTRENMPDTFLRQTCFQLPTKYCQCCLKARRQCLTWGRCLTVFRIIFGGQRYRTEQPEGSVNCKETDPLILYTTIPTGGECNDMLYLSKGAR